MTSYLLAGPAIEPVTLEEAKKRLDVVDTNEDGLITTLIAAARLHLEAITGRALIEQTWRMVINDWPQDRSLKVPVAPVLRLDAVTLLASNGQSAQVTLDQFTVDGNRITASRAVPTSELERNGFEIDYVAGYGPTAEDVPADLREALLSLVGYWFENRDAVIISGSGSVVPSGFDAKVAPYRSVRP